MTHSLDLNSDVCASAGYPVLWWRQPYNREVGMALVVSRGQVTGPRRLGLLPAEATSFVGRKTELVEVSMLLEAARMVTVAGSPGVGKTRFALRAAAEAADQFPDGVWLVDLAVVFRGGRPPPAPPG